jgi:hypothetical protein
MAGMTYNEMHYGRWPQQEYTTTMTCDVGNLSEAFSHGPKEKTMKLSSMMKRLLDKDTQVLVKAGFLNGDLELTGDGQKALLAILFMATKVDMVKAAQEKLDDEASEKK